MIYKAPTSIKESGRVNVNVNVNEFYVFRQERFHSPNKLPAENGRNINGNIYVEL